MGDVPSENDVLSFLTRKESIGKLEDRLARAAAEYFSLKEQEDRLDFGEPLTQDRLQELIPQVIDPTNAFLGVTSLQPPAQGMFNPRKALKAGLITGLGAAGVIGFTSGSLLFAGIIGVGFGASVTAQLMCLYSQTFYDYRDKAIIINDKRSVNAAGSIAHEYAHYVQDRKGILEEKDFITEGHARGVEHHIARVFAERHDNPAYLYDVTNQTAKELKSAYLYLCRKARKTPRTSLEKNNIPDIGGLLYHLSAHHYRMGVAAMCIAERQYGMHVYRKVLEKDFSFLGMAP